MGRNTVKRISYIKQKDECRENETAYYERCASCNHRLLVCKKFGGQCYSNKCKDMRVIDDHKAEAQSDGE